MEPQLPCKFEEWKLTGDRLKDTSDYWSCVINVKGKIIWLAHSFDENGHLIQIREADIGSMTYRNQPVQYMVNAGLILLGQLFPVNELSSGSNTDKSYAQVEQEWYTRIPIGV